MGSSFRLLKEYISEIIAEKAISPSIAVGEGLALHVYKGSDWMRMILYSPSDLAKGIKESEAEFGKSLSHSLAAIKVNSPMTDGYVYAYFAASKYDANRAWNAWEVINAAALKGYGPMMYDAVMATVGTIMSDRQSVSDMAQKVWKYYKDSRSDVEALKIDDKDHPSTPPKIDDGPVHSQDPNDPLNYAYRSKGKPTNVNALEQKHAAAAEEISSKLGVSVKIIEDAIEEGGEEFFRSKYNYGD